MPTLEELVIQISADNKELAATLKSTQQLTAKATADMAESIKKMSEEGSKSTSFLSGSLQVFAGSILKDAVVKGFQLASQAAMNFAGLILKDGVAAATAEEEALNRLTQSLALSGEGANGAAEKFANFAEATEKSTKFQKDAILTTGALIQNIAQLGEKDLERATKASADFAAAMGIDLESAARIVGKAIDGNVTALQRYGITVAEGMNKTDQMNAVLNKLGSAFGGTAKSQVQTFAGTVDQMSKGFEDVLKVFGNAIIKNHAVIAAFNAVGVVLKQFGTFLEDNKKNIQVFIADGVVKIVDALRVLVAISDGVFSAMKFSVEALKAPFVALYSSIAAIGQLIMGDLSGAFETMKQAVVGTFEEMKSAATDSNPAFEKIGGALTFVGASAQDAMSKVVAGQEAAMAATNSHTAAVQKFSDEQMKSGEIGKGIADELIKQSEDKQARANEQLELLKQQQADGLISEQEYQDQKNAIIMQAEADKFQAINDAYATGLITPQRYEAAVTEMARQSAAEKVKLTREEAKLREATISSSLGAIAGLQNSSNKELAALGKAAAITQAIRDGILAVQNVLATVPYPFSIPLAAAMGVTAAANVAKIAGLQSGIDEVPGAGFSDNFPAMLAPGERVVPRSTNQDLKGFLNNQKDGGGGGKSGITINVNVSGNLLNRREEAMHIVEVLNEASQSLGLKMLGAGI